ncbi:MAG TPA: DUF3006 family protein [Anaerolineales bacterium]
MKAVVEQFEAEFAVLVVAEDERRMIVLRKLLPEQVREGQSLKFDILEGELHNISIDEQGSCVAGR